MLFLTAEASLGSVHAAEPALEDNASDATTKPAIPKLRRTAMAPPPRRPKGGTKRCRYNVGMRSVVNTESAALLRGIARPHEAAAYPFPVRHARVVHSGEAAHGVEPQR